MKLVLPPTFYPRQVFTRSSRQRFVRHISKALVGSYKQEVFLSKNSKIKIQNYSSKFKSDLKERCYQFSLQIIALTDSLPNKRSAWIITDQLIRSATSIGANLIEARASSSRLEFKKFYEISLKSANESKY